MNSINKVMKCESVLVTEQFCLYGRLNQLHRTHFTVQ